MRKQSKTWVYSPPKSQPSKGLKAEISAKATLLVDSILKPQHVKPPRKNARFNYVADIWTKWRGNSFYFCARYNCPGPNALSPFFDTTCAKMEYIGRNRFNLSYMRYTGRWQQVFSNETADVCLQRIQEGHPVFLP